MEIFGPKSAFCNMCNKQITHKHKPKREWKVDGPLCGDCYVNQMKIFYDRSLRQQCIICNVEKDVPDMWEPRYQWDMEGLLCKPCFDKKEEEHKSMKEFCKICNKKLGTIRYNPKKKWDIKGQLCRQCWDSQKARFG